MAFSKLTLSFVALVGGGALIAATACEVTNDTDTTGDGGSTSNTGGMGSGGMGTGGQGTGGMADPATCQAYCTANIANCTGANAQWDTADPTPMETCLDWCTLYDQGNVGDQTGDNLECRMYHTGAAAADAATHCPHSGPFGGGVCGASQCEVMCGVMQELICTGAESQYLSEQECIEECGGLTDKDTPYTADANRTNDADQAFRCRGYHLSAALDAPDPHCEHAAGDGTICN